MSQMIASLRADRAHYHGLWLQTRSPKWRAKAQWAARTLRSLGQ